MRQIIYFHLVSIFLQSLRIFQKYILKVCLNSFLLMMEVVITHCKYFVLCKMRKRAVAIFKILLFFLSPPPAQCKIKIIDFSRNFGKESAIYAGLQASKGDCVALIDADLQDPPTMLLEMYKKWQDNEADIIYARRISRAGESFIRAKLSEGFYVLSNLISSVHLESGVRDFRCRERYE